MDTETKRVRLCTLAISHDERNVIVLFERAKVLDLGSDSLHRFGGRQVSMPLKGRQEALLAELVARGVERFGGAVGIERQCVSSA